MTTEITLTKGQTTIIDDEDRDLCDLGWRCIGSKDDGYYAGRTIKHNEKPFTARLHRIILGRVLGRELKPYPHELVDHVDGDRLNNRRSNLRLANFSTNGMNRKRSSSNTSGYKGVSWHKHKRRWQAKIKLNGKTTHLGYFYSAKRAHSAYCLAAEQYHGEFARAD